MEDPASLVGTTLLGRYEITQMLGRGGMGVVLEGVRLPDRLPVAVKVLHGRTQRKGALRRFQREASTAASIGRPHVADVYEVGRLPSGEPYFVMERLHGETLRARVDREHWLELPRVVAVFSQLLTALEAVHARALVHRDIKPDNIFCAGALDTAPVVKLIDFGVVKLMDPRREPRSEEDTGPITHTGIVVGTPAYVAPEQIVSPKEVDGRCDLWGCGVSLYETITGRLPFNAATAPLLMLEILNGTPPPVTLLRPECPPLLAHIVHKALEKVPEKRYPDAQSFRRDLLTFWSEYRTLPPPPLPRARMESASDVDTAEHRLPFVELSRFADLPPIPTPNNTTPGSPETDDG